MRSRQCLINLIEFRSQSHSCPGAQHLSTYSFVATRYPTEKLPSCQFWDSSDQNSPLIHWYHRPSGRFFAFLFSPFVHLEGFGLPTTVRRSRHGANIEIHNLTIRRRPYGIEVYWAIRFGPFSPKEKVGTPGKAKTSNVGGDSYDVFIYPFYGFLVSFRHLPPFEGWNGLWTFIIPVPTWTVHMVYGLPLTGCFHLYYLWSRILGWLFIRLKGVYVL